MFGQTDIYILRKTDIYILHKKMCAAFHNQSLILDETLILWRIQEILNN